MSKMPPLKGKNRNPQLLPLARAIQAAMQARGLNVMDLVRAMGLQDGQNAAVFNWAAAKHAPTEPYRAKLAEVLGLDVDEIRRLIPATKGRAVAPAKAALGPAQKALVLAKQVLPAELVVGPPALPPASDVFVIRGRTDGSMVIKLDANMPFSRGAVMAKFLMDFGLVAGDGDDER